MNIAVIGVGYVGLVSGVGFSEMGNSVICMDNNVEKIEKLNKGELTIYEPDLSFLLKRNVQRNCLFFTTNLKKAVQSSEIIFLALPTPPKVNGDVDLAYISEVIKQLSFLINAYKIIVIKSTVPVGTSEKAKEIISKITKFPFDVVSNPEFLREGIAINDFLKPDRVIIGTSSKRAEQIMINLYTPFVRQGNPIHIMDERSAEITKYAANSYLAMRITYMNEIANLCKRLEANIDHVRKGMGSDTRIGKDFLFPGVGYGGSCLPKDVQAFQKIAQNSDRELKILKAVSEVNDKQRILLVEKVKAYFNNNLSNKKIAIWGLSFKPNTDDIRESASLYTINALLEKGVKIIAFDPEAIEKTQFIYKDKIVFTSDCYEALKGVDALLILTEWSIFRIPDFGRMKKLMNRKVIFDGRNLYTLEQMRAQSYYYDSIGRKTIKNTE